MSFGTFLKGVLDERDINLNQLQMLTGIDSGHLSRIVRSVRNEPKPVTIKKICVALNIDPDEGMRHAGYIDAHSEEMQAKAKNIAQKTLEFGSKEETEFRARAIEAGMTEKQYLIMREYVHKLANG